MKTKVLIITGFLGAGKTTLIKHILKFHKNLPETIILVNEFGRIGIDGSLIKNSAVAQIVELSSGCICCTLKTDMIQSLKRLKHEYTPEQVIIESTGVADPVSIIDALNDKQIVSDFQLYKVITIVDSDFWEAREAFGTVFQSQLNQADLIVLNKIDTIDKSQTSILLKEIRKETAKAFVIPAVHCNIDPDIVFSSLNREPDDIKPHTIFKPYNAEMDYYSSLNEKEVNSAKEAGFISFSFETDKILDRKTFLQFLSSIPLELYRIKGIVRFEQETQILNFVGGKAHWQDWTESTSTCLVFIGWQVMEKSIIEKLNICIK